MNERNPGKIVFRSLFYSSICHGFNTGSNLRLLQDSSGLDPWECSSVELKKMLHEKVQVPVPVQDRWRLQYLATLLAQRQELHYMGAVDEEEKLTVLIDSLCIN